MGRKTCHHRAGGGSHWTGGSQRPDSKLPLRAGKSCKTGNTCRLINFAPVQMGLWLCCLISRASDSRQWGSWPGVALEDKKQDIEGRRERLFQKGGGKCSTQLSPRWMEHDGPFIHPVTGSFQGRTMFCAVISACWGSRHYACLPGQPLLGSPWVCSQQKCWVKSV